MKTSTLGDLTVSAQGLGCMGMSQAYGVPEDQESIATLNRALDLGVTFLDTANVYGDGANELLLSKVVTARRDEITLATKFGLVWIDGDTPRARMETRGDAAYVRECCEASLRRLGTDLIDLYYLHRPPRDVEIEETVGAMGGLVEAGKVRHLGLSEVDSEQLRRAHAVHPIAAVQSEYSLWTRDVESVSQTMSELGVGLVPFSPLGRGFLTGTFDRSSLAADDFRNRLPRFGADAADQNQRILTAVAAVAVKHGCQLAQVALAWVYAQAERLGVSVVPIPGTKRRTWLDQNVAALDVHLDADDLAALDPLAGQVAGSRY
jgi:aryl-alcohol dehydrogenase-like predicted oxidoreductase